MASEQSVVPGALLRLWLLAEIGMAALYGWQAALLAGWSPELPPPRPLPAVAIIEAICLCLFLPAAVVTIQRWRATRDRPLAGLALAYGLASAASFAAWAAADTTGNVRALYGLDAVIALSGAAVALRALRLR